MADHIMGHAEYYERTVLNAVLGTQRGTQPGEMLYMYPMGSGVSKAGIPDAPQGHHWSDPEHHFWCCQGSGVEAFARIADSVFWLHNPAPEDPGSPPFSGDGSAAAPYHLFVLQYISSELEASEIGCKVRWQAEHVGSALAGDPLRAQLYIAPTRAHPGAAGAERKLVVWVRMPRWAASAELEVAPHDAGTRVRREIFGTPSAGKLVPLQMHIGGRGSAEHVEGEPELVATIALTPQIMYEQVKDVRAEFRSLQAVLYGPLVLAGLTYGERVLRDSHSHIVPVPASARDELVTLELQPQQMRDGAVAAQEGCLVSAWENVWTVHADRTRSWVKYASASCLAKAKEHELSVDLARLPKRGDGEGPDYVLDERASAAACTQGGCLSDGSSPFLSGRLVLMHNGTRGRVMMAARPSRIQGLRIGGSDAANAATWRMTSRPLAEYHPGRAQRPHRSEILGPEVTPNPSNNGNARLPVVLEAFDRPGYVLTAEHGSGRLTLTRLRQGSPGEEGLGYSDTPATQWWHVRNEDGASLSFESTALPGHWLTLQSSLQRRESGATADGSMDHSPDEDEAQSGGMIHRDAVASQQWTVGFQQRASGRNDDLPHHQGEPARFNTENEGTLAEYAKSSFWAIGSDDQEHIDGRNHFLLMPLNEMVDEHYTVYFCKLQMLDAVPDFCGP
ncbi:hypothetical protein CYMTET_48541 [Cymbomonas tetramitiformis]|uniref:Non-reducing end beta-L-arabinofuranosidase-like GH127 catalytic domain-containing protein n=1 Tax=Cymbomonas tetramitiformis TaxID=36881 RepID=A0AAE0BTB8_9CHLO|nr:hypothetical protein CYMTET_48541 [Cymbomonas tetramitiformis]